MATCGTFDESEKGELIKQENHQNRTSCINSPAILALYYGLQGR